jgi:glutathione S-transferase
MKLYYTKGVCSLAVRIMLHELKLDCEYEAVNLMAKTTESGKDYLAINPKGSVPALLLNNGECLTENAVILQYLADEYHAKHLLPSVGEMSRYRTLEWLNFISTDLHRTCAPMFMPFFPDEIKKNVFLPTFRKKIAVVNEHLAGNHCLMGNEFTIADCYLLVILVWMKRLELPINEWPHLSRYFEEMKKRPSVHQAMQDEKLL